MSIEQVWDDKDGGEVVPEGEYTIQVDARDLAGNPATQLSITVLVDVTAPTAPDADLLVVTMNPPGTTDTIEGLEGAVEANALVTIYSNPSLEPTYVIDTTSADETGTFTATDIGDDAYTEVWVTATDPAGNESPATSKTNPPPLPLAIILIGILATIAVVVVATLTALLRRRKR